MRLAGVALSVKLGVGTVSVAVTVWTVVPEVPEIEIV